VKAVQLNNPIYSNRLTRGRVSDWLYVLAEDYRILLLGRRVRDCIIRSNGLVIASIDANTLTIKSGFAWNGMTMWPDSPMNILPSAVHDLGYQVGHHKQNPMQRQEWDQLLRALMARNGDRCAGVCYAAVRSAGWAFYSEAKDISIVP